MWATSSHLTSINDPVVGYYYNHNLIQYQYQTKQIDGLGIFTWKITVLEPRL